MRYKFSNTLWNTVNYGISCKEKEIMKFADKRMELEKTTISSNPHPERQTLHVLSHLCS